MKDIKQKPSSVIGLKELRLNVDRYANEVARGKSFTVIRRSKPIFRISPVEEDGLWEAVIDFTKIRKGGVPLSELLARL